MIIYLVLAKILRVVGEVGRKKRSMQVFAAVLMMMEQYRTSDRHLATQLHFRVEDRWLEEQTTLRMMGSKEAKALREAKSNLAEVTAREWSCIEEQSSQYLSNLAATTGLTITADTELAHRILYGRRTLHHCADSDAAFVKAVATIAEAVANVNQARKALFDLLFPEET
jgi:hypothetical protein